MPEKPDRTPKEVNDPFVRRLTDEFKKARVERGLSQKKLAELAGVGRSGLVTFESYHRMPSAWFCKRLADGLGVPLAELVSKAEKGN